MYVVNLNVLLFRKVKGQATWVQQLHMNLIQRQTKMPGLFLKDL